jgi:predicted XRE-type DNA-binding protein
MNNKYPPIAQDFINTMKRSFIGKGADPSSVVIKDLWQKNSTSTFSKDSFKNTFDTGMSMETQKVFSDLMTIYNSHIETKRQLLQQARALYDNDIVQAIIDVMIDDGFSSFTDEENDLKVTYRTSGTQEELIGDTFKETVQGEIDDLFERFDLKARIADMIPELLRDGEFAYGITFDNNQGITDVIDDLDVIDLLPFFSGDKMSFIIKQEQISSSVGSTVVDKKSVPVLYNPENIVYFRLKYNSKERVKLEPTDARGNVSPTFRKNFYKETGIYLPKYIRICRPIFYNAMNKIQQLQLMENVNTAQELAQVVRPEVLTVAVPPNTSPIEAKNIVRDYERQLNTVINDIDINNLDISTLASLANKRKVLPQWGDGKGVVAGSDLNNLSRSEQTRGSIIFLRNLIAIDLGIPPFYLTIDGTPVEKGQLIKMYSRYTRKLSNVQKAVSDGIKDLILAHLRAKNIYVERSSLDVTFKSLTTADSLDDVDIMVAVITQLIELFKGLAEISHDPQAGLKMNTKQYKKVFDIYTNKYLGFSDLLEYEEFDEDHNDDNFEGEGGDMGFVGTEGPEGNQTPDSGMDTTTSGGSSATYDSFANDSANNVQDTGGPQDIQTEV